MRHRIDTITNVFRYIDNFKCLDMCYSVSKFFTTVIFRVTYLWNTTPSTDGRLRDNEGREPGRGGGCAVEIHTTPEVLTMNMTL